MSRCSTLAALMVLVVTGCARTTDSTETADSVTHWNIEVTAVVSVGDDSMGPEYALNGVIDATRLSDGRIAIGNGGTHEVRVFHPDGSFSHSVGREGQGPGEFQYMYALDRLDGDNLRVTSIRPGQSTFTAAGEFLDSKVVDIWSMRVPCRLGEGGFAPTLDGSFLVAMDDNFYGSDCPTAPGPIWRMSTLIALWDGENPVLDTLAILPGTERNSPNYRAYGAQAVRALGAEHIFASDTRSDTIHVWAADGSVHSTFTHGFPADPIPPEATTADVRRWERNGEEHIGNEYVYPETYPRIARMLVDELGNLWVMKYPPVTDPLLSSAPAFSMTYMANTGPEPTQWEVYAPDGTLVARATLPRGLFPLEIGEDYVLGMTKDELDVQYVRIHELTRFP